MTNDMKSTLSSHMNEFQPHFIEEAISHLFDQNPQTKNQAGDYLKQWVQSEHAEITAFIILQRSINLHSRQYAAFSLVMIAEKNWGNFDNNLKNEIKLYSVSQLSATNIPENLKNLLYKLLVTIAIYEWPEVWPEFLQTLSNPTPDQSLKSRVTLLGHFSAELQVCKIVPYNRLMYLRTMFANSAQQLLDLSSFVLSNDSSLISSVLMILNSLLNYSMEQVFNPELLNHVMEMTLNSKTQGLAFKILTTVFINRYDFGGIFKVFGPAVLQFFASLQSLQTPTFVFLVAFLKKYSIVIEYIGNAQLGSKVVELVLGDSFDSVAQSLSDPSVLGYLQQIYSLIFSGDVPTVAKKSFWKLLEVILTRMISGPSLTIFAPLLPLIRNAFLSHLPNAIENGRILYPSVSVSVSCLLKIDNSFLAGQEISLGLIYALGFMPATDFTFQTLENLLQPTSEYLPAVLFTLSRLNIFSPQFIHMALQALEFSTDHNAQIAASRALLFSFRTFPSQFQIEIPNIVAKSLSLITSIDNDAAIRMCKLCCLGGAFPQISQFIASLITNDTLFALECFREMFYVSDSSANFVNLFQPLLNCLSQTSSQKVTQMIFSALTALIANTQFSQIENYVDIFMSSLFRVPQIADISYGAIAVCRARHSEFDRYFDDIQKLIQSAQTITPNLFKMIAEFPPNLFNVSFIAQIVSAGIADVDSTEEALICSRVVLKKYGESAPEVIWKTITIATIKAFIDGQHCFAFEKQTNVLFLLIAKIDNNSLGNVIMSVIKECLHGTKMSEIQRFVEEMIQNAEDLFTFRQFTANFLVAMRRITELDLTSFNKKTIHKKLLNLEVGEQEAAAVFKFRKNFDDDPPIESIPPFLIRKRKI